MDNSNRDNAEAETPADRLTPHEPADPRAAGEVEPELPTGIVDPRRLPGPEILDPPAPGLPLPSEERTSKSDDHDDG